MSGAHPSSPSSAFPGPSSSSSAFPGPSSSSSSFTGLFSSSPTFPGPSSSSPAFPGPSSSSSSFTGLFSSSPAFPGPSSSSPAFPGPSSSSSSFTGLFSSSPAFPGPSSSSPAFPGPSSSSSSFSGLSSSSSEQDIGGDGGTAGPRRGVKRPVGVIICNRSVESWEDKSSEIACPICFELLSEAVITVCGHTYCRDCILSSISFSPLCPKCGNIIDEDSLIPNFALDEIVKRHVTSLSVKTEAYENARSSDVEPISIVNFFSSNKYHEPTITEIDSMMLILEKKKAKAEEEERALLSDFLSELLKTKKAQKLQLDKELNLIEQDISQVQSSQGSMIVESSQRSSSQYYGTSFSNGFNATQVPELEHTDKQQLTLSARKHRVMNHFDELSQIYMESRNADINQDSPKDPIVSSGSGVTLESNCSLDDFESSLFVMSRYHALKPLATIFCKATSIEFDKDNELFAAAGYSKNIKLFDYDAVIGTSDEAPAAELSCSTMSCLAWSGYFLDALASSDLVGCVSLWDVSTGYVTRLFIEHDEKVWSVDWSKADPRLLATGSEDFKVKLWSTNSEKSVLTLKVEDDVYSVKFCPQNSFAIAFGGADHCVHYYDFRQPKTPLGILRGHKKAVTLVTFVSQNELLSSSIDNQLRLWNLNVDSPEYVRSFSGHVNEFNCLGLATDGNYIVCGAENNSVSVYYKYLSKPLFSFEFESYLPPVVELPIADKITESIATVTWKKGSPVVIAANRSGDLKVLELI